MKQIFMGLTIMFFLTTGFYPLHAGEKLTAALCKNKVIQAAQLVQKVGNQSFEEIRDPNGRFRFAGGQGYIWINDLDGVMIMHPIKPSLEGKGLYNLKDEKGTYFFMAFNEIAETHGAGWVAYFWPKPGQEKSAPKVSYVKLVKHEDKEYVLGSGLYDVTYEDIKKTFPKDAVYENQ